MATATTRIRNIVSLETLVLSLFEASIRPTPEQIEAYEEIVKNHSATARQLTDAHKEAVSELSGGGMTWEEVHAVVTTELGPISQELVDLVIPTLAGKGIAGFNELKFQTLLMQWLMDDPGNKDAVSAAMLAVPGITASLKEIREANKASNDAKDIKADLDAQLQSDLEAVFDAMYSELGTEFDQNYLWENSTTNK